MRVIVLRSTFVAGVVVQADSAPVEMADAAALQLIAMGKAMLAPPVLVAVETPQAVDTPRDAPVPAMSKPKGKGKFS